MKRPGQPGPLLVAILAVAQLASTAKAENRTVEEVQGKQTSLALMMRAMKHPAGRFCGARLAVLELKTDALGALTVQVASKTPVKENQVMKLARTLPSGHSVMVVYCTGSEKNQIVTGTTVTHVRIEGKHSWGANTIKNGESIAKKKPPKADPPTDAEIEEALVESARRLNRSLPMMVDKHLRLDRLVGGNKTLQYHYTLVDHDADAVDAAEFRHGMRARLVNEVCEDEEMGFLLENGVRYRYRYQGKDQQEIATISIRASDCK